MTNTQKPKDSYQAGSCNIGDFEVKRRMRSAWLGLALSLALYIFLTINKVDRWSYAWEFFPLMIFSSGLIQAQSKFCFAYGFKGWANLGRKSDRISVVDKEALKADRSYALTVLTRSVGVAIIVTGLIIGIS